MEKLKELGKKLSQLIAPLVLRFVVFNKDAIIADLEARAAKSENKLDDYAVKGFARVLEALEEDGI